MKSFKDRIYAPTPDPRPGGGYKLLAALVGYWSPGGEATRCPTLGLGYGALRNCVSLKKTAARIAPGGHL